MRERLKNDLLELMQIAGLSGHEDRVRRALRDSLASGGIAARSDVLGNLIATLPGADACPTVMIFAHMDQLGFVVRKIENNGLLRVVRLGGVPERALAAQPVCICVAEGNDLTGVIANKSHHVTAPDEKSMVLPTKDIFIDAGLSSKAEAEDAGIRIGTPCVYAPAVRDLGNRVAGTAVDDRVGCAVLLEVARQLTGIADRPTVHIVFSVQEEFNLRGAVVAAQALQPDIALQIDLMVASDTPDTEDIGDMRLGGGPGISLYSFHGRGTLNGVIPHPGLVQHVEDIAQQEEIPLQRSAQVGILTDLSYVQLVGGGVAALDLGFPMRYSHSANEMCDMSDLVQLTQLLVATVRGITPDFPLLREELDP